MTGGVDIWEKGKGKGVEGWVGCLGFLDVCRL